MNLKCYMMLQMCDIEMHVDSAGQTSKHMIEFSFHTKLPVYRTLLLLNIRNDSYHSIDCTPRLQVSRVFAGLTACPPSS